MEKDADSFDGFNNFNDPFKDEFAQTLENPTDTHLKKDAESSDGFENFNDPFKDNIAQTLDNPADSHVEEQVAEAQVEEDAES